MHRFPKLFTSKNQNQQKMNSTGTGAGAGARTGTGTARPRPRLDRRNAAKNIDYEASSFSSASTSTSSYSPENSYSMRTRSLDVFPWGDKTSFRIEGNDGEFEIICKSLGLSGPEDFAIPAAAWEALKRRTSSDVLPRINSFRVTDVNDQKIEGVFEVLDDSRVSDVISVTDGGGESVVVEDSVEVAEVNLEKNEIVELVECVGRCNGGIKGLRPPVLAPPLAMMTLRVIDSGDSSWDLLRSFAPENERVVGLGADGGGVANSEDEEGGGNRDGEGEEEVEEEGNGMLRRRMSIAGGGGGGWGGALSGSTSFSTNSNQDDSSSTSTEPTSNVSPNGRFRREILSWERGKLLGRGSFGSVYEGMADAGFFFAVKEVSMLDQGEEGRQSIYQLEQEIALLSQFEHENIVQYYGTDKDESKLYIFLELVNQGSLLSLYQRLHLRDSQVSVYTRQILHGLKYLHDRNVVHRDIKCANILVDVHGFVKLADFGLAKATKLNDVKSCKGTPYWMAPEVVNLRNQGYGLAADIWSLGCTVLEMLTRQFPYSHLENMQALFRIGRGELPRVPDSLSRDARDFILKCLQVDPDARPTAAELLDHSFVRRLLPSSASASPHHPDRGI